MASSLGGTCASSLYAAYSSGPQKHRMGRRHTSSSTRPPRHLHSLFLSSLFPLLCFLVALPSSRLPRLKTRLMFHVLHSPFVHDTRFSLLHLSPFRSYLNSFASSLMLPSRPQELAQTLSLLHSMCSNSLKSPKFFPSLCNTLPRAPPLYTTMILLLRLSSSQKNFIFPCAHSSFLSFCLALKALL